MSARFRIRTTQGQELSFASRDMFAEFVRSGDLSPQDVVYDAETREWSSALTHPVVLQIELEAEEEAAGETPETSVTSDADEGDEGEVDAGAGIDLDLAPAPAGLTPDQEAAAFVAKMAAERASEIDFDGDVPGLKMKMETGAPGLVEDLAPPSPPSAPPAAPPAGRPRERPEPPRQHTRAPRRQDRAAAPDVPAKPKKQKKKKKKAGTGAARRYAPFALLGAAAVAALVFLGPDLLTLVRGDGSATGPETEVEPPPPPLIPDTEEALAARARERFLTSTQAALRGLEPIPQAWLRGSYLAEPSDYPEVRQAWDHYLNTIRQVRAGDGQRYREAYLRALDDAQVEGDARTVRLNNAIAAFGTSAAARGAHYDRVERLATAAIRGHDTLVGAEGTIAYQPATGPALSADPVIEAVGRSAQAQALLNQVLDVILAELHAERGPGQTGNVREWVWSGLLAAVTG